MLGIYKVENGVKYKYGKDDIIESIVRILFTLPGERVGNPTFGCSLRGLLFEPEFIFLDEVTSVINKSISSFETRVYLKNIDIERISTQEYKIYLYFHYRTTDETILVEQNIIT